MGKISRTLVSTATLKNGDLFHFESDSLGDVAGDPGTPYRVFVEYVSGSTLFPGRLKYTENTVTEVLTSVEAPAKVWKYTDHAVVEPHPMVGRIQNFGGQLVRVVSVVYLENDDMQVTFKPV